MSNYWKFSWLWVFSGCAQAQNSILRFLRWEPDHRRDAGNIEKYKPSREKTRKKEKEKKKHEELYSGLHVFVNCTDIYWRKTQILSINHFYSFFFFFFFLNSRIPDKFWYTVVIEVFVLNGHGTLSFLLLIFVSI